MICAQPNQAKFKPGVEQSTWEDGYKTYTLIKERVTWADDSDIDGGSLAYVRGWGVSTDAWFYMDTSDSKWPAVKEALKAQEWPQSGPGWKNANAYVIRTETDVNPHATIDLSIDRPYNLVIDGEVKTPTIVAFAEKGTLYIAWQGWTSQTRETKNIFVDKIGIESLPSGQLARVRRLEKTQGQFVGFTVDDKGTDYVLAAKAEDPPYNTPPDFAATIDNVWRPNVLQLFSGGRAHDLNNDKFTTKTFYGIINGGTGRLAYGNGLLAATFARRFSDGKVIHQEADDMLMSRTLDKVPLRAGNQASHSFDQRLAFDGKDFVTLHLGDEYPWPGMTIEKINSSTGEAAQFPAYCSPTWGLSCYFDLGGIAVEPDGYPVQFTATRNTSSARAENEGPLYHMAWDLAMVYVVRNFETKKVPDNPFDILGSGILADGFAPDQSFSFDTYVWDDATKSSRPDKRKTIKRRVAWLTQNDSKTRAIKAKLVKLADGKYISIWEENALASPDEWNASLYLTTRAALISITGSGGSKKITKVKEVELKGVRVDAGDDAIPMTVDGNTVAAWVTSGATNRQLLLRTLDADLSLKSYVLRLP